MIKHRTPAPTRRRSAGGLTAYLRRADGLGLPVQQERM